MKVLVNLDLGQNMLLGLVLEALAADPSSPIAGRMYYNTSSGAVKFYNGSSWVVVGSGGDAATLNGQAGSYYLARANHTGTQLAATISDLATTVQAYRLDQFAAPTANLNINSNRLTNVTDPTSAQDAATKNYVDNIAQGVVWKSAVAAATTSALAANTYANGSSGVGATLTANSNGAIAAVDGYTPAASDRLLVKNEATGSHNGIYTVTQVGDSSHPYILTRATDMDDASEIAGAAVLVLNGTTNLNQGWIVDSAGPYTVGTTTITFTQFTGVSDITAGTGLAKSGNTLSQDTANGYGVRKVAAAIGDGSSTSIDVTHNLGTRDVAVAVYQNSSTWDVVYPDIQYKDTNTVTIIFATAPASNAYRVVVIG